MQPHHHGLTVSDLDTALEFYRDTLGFEEKQRTYNQGDQFSTVVGIENAEAEMAFLEANGMYIELFEYHPPGRDLHRGTQSNDDIGAQHVAFAVEDLDQRYELLADDVEVVNPPVEGGTGAKVMYVYDPDGNVVELLERGTWKPWEE